MTENKDTLQQTIEELEILLEPLLEYAAEHILEYGLDTTGKIDAYYDTMDRLKNLGDQQMCTMEGFDESPRVNVELSQNQIKLLIKTLMDVIEVYQAAKGSELQYLVMHLMGHRKVEAQENA